jgi:hypothetical protein
MTNSRYGRGLILAITTPNSVKVQDKEIYYVHNLVIVSGEESINNQFGQPEGMNGKLLFATVYIALTVGMISTLFVNIAMASSGNDPRSARACDEMVDLEGRQDARTEDDSTIPDSDRGTEKANEGAEKALGDCPVE